MAVIITSNKSVDINQGIKTNVEIIDGKLLLKIVRQYNRPSETNSIPKMTSNTTPSPFVVTASSVYSATYDAWKAFNGTISDVYDCWVSADGLKNGWIKFDFYSPKAICNYSIVNRNYSTAISTAPKDWTFEGSNNDSDWITLDVRSNETNWLISQKRTYSFLNNTKYRYYRLNVTSNNGEAFIAIGDIEMMESVLANIYSDSGTYESNTLDLGQYFRQVKSISAIKGVPTGTEVKVYTSTSTDNLTFSPYSLVDVNGIITSPQARFIKIKVELIGKLELQNVTLNSFSSQEASQFQPDDQTLFDKGLQLKTVYIDNMQKDSAWNETGSLFRKSLDKSIFRQIDKIEVI
ncbi:discoidin domain-containing protein [Paenibacillus oleatilyticus]|uniref:discoidin domain-containing protein n=1 Tax=Paenibacillus oleatilyticus TaxID=2594886 RepID=UPI001C1FCB11|nr:discoidin domain-containing protein [Paenibacillus oleatilyticus]MBU7316165.1 discoidin domain-containing protein [Paenibacillus oleatilyticus]